MSRKTVKELDAELSQVKKNLEDMKDKFDSFVVKYETLERKYAECLSKKTNLTFKCSNCDLKFGNKNELHRHMKSEHSRKESFKCDDCEYMFDEKWKLNAHSKNHKTYPCEQCDKSFKQEDIKEKHIRIVHENVKLYCHYFNNEKECPHIEDCVFLHEESAECNYGDFCERDYCMFKHVYDTLDDHGNDDKENDQSNETFENPSQEKNVEVPDVSGGVTDSNEQNIEPKNKYPCNECDMTFVSKKKLKNHDYNVHSVHSLFCLN